MHTFNMSAVCAAATHHAIIELTSQAQAQVDAIAASLERGIHTALIADGVMHAAATGKPYHEPQIEVTVSVDKAADIGPDGLPVQPPPAGLAPPLSPLQRTVCKHFGDDGEAAYCFTMEQARDAEDHLLMFCLTEAKDAKHELELCAMMSAAVEKLTAMQNSIMAERGVKVKAPKK
jgi:hypothetical protein